jgi:MYND finger
MFDCPVCFNGAPFHCPVCKTVNYCSKDCQKVHWKLSHKESCQPNPRKYKVCLDLSVFAGLPRDCFEGHEFLMVKPTEKFGSLQEICSEVLESADDLFDVPGFGQNQLNPAWLQGNYNHSVYKHMVQKFGWASGRMAQELVCGYRVAEARVIYFVWFDDCFQTQLSMPSSYYGEGLLPPLSPGKLVRGNLVVSKFILKAKQRKSKPAQSPVLTIQLTDDADVQFEYILVPMNKAELALMLSERKHAMELGAYTTRMWRYQIRLKERLLEVQKAAGTHATVAF